MPVPTRYGELSFIERLKLIPILSFIPCVALMGALAAPWGVHWEWNKSWSRILKIRILRYMLGAASTPQLQWLLGSSLVIYTRWIAAQGCQPVVDEIGEGARLLWLGNRRYDRMILYIPGGAYVLPVYEDLMDFVHLLQREVGGSTSSVGLAILDYGLVPYVNFPSQLQQANAAISHLFAAGVSSQNLQIVSDSAGSNLIIQVLSHALHPIDSIPRSPLTPMLKGTMPPIRGIYMLSPWTFHGMRYGKVVHSHCFDENDANDFASASMLRYWASSVFPRISHEQQPYIEAAAAPSDWLEDVHLLVDRVLITAAQYECLRDHIVEFCHTHMASVESLKLVLVEGAVHGDPILTAGIPEGKVIKQKVVSWLKEGFYI